MWVSAVRVHGGGGGGRGGGGGGGVVQLGSHRAAGEGAGARMGAPLPARFGRLIEMEALVCRRLADEQGAVLAAGGGADPAPLDLSGELAADLARSLLLEEEEEEEEEEAADGAGGDDAGGEAADGGAESDNSSDGGGSGI